MRDAVTTNQGFVQEEFALGPVVPPAADGRRCWVLLVRVDADRVDLELSVPDGMRDGVVVSWAERIPLPPLALGDPGEPGEPGEPIDVPVVPLP
jgi:hypothetical protein